MSDSLLERRRIEALFVKGIFEELAIALGRQQAADLLARAITRMAEEAGRQFAAAQARADLDAFAEILPVWQQNEALSVTIHARESGRLDFDVTRCRYAEMYRELGIAELGAVLSCNRDGAFCTGFNPTIRMARTQTIMAGADHCDFRYVLE